MFSPQLVRPGLNPRLLIGIRISALQPVRRARPRLPHRVPVAVDVSALRADQTVETGAARIDRKDVAAAAVEERVQHDQHVILVVQLGVSGLGEGDDAEGSGSLQTMPMTISVAFARTLTIVLPAGSPPSCGSIVVSCHDRLCSRPGWLGQDAVELQLNLGHGSRTKSG